MYPNYLLVQAKRRIKSRKRARRAASKRKNIGSMVKHDGNVAEKCLCIALPICTLRCVQQTAMRVDVSSRVPTIQRS